MLQSTVELGAAMAGATDHRVTIASVNLGLVEAALTGQNARKHLSEIERIVNQLFEHHSIKILCMVEVGKPRKGLLPDTKKLFEQAVRAGAANHTRGDLAFLWADRNEAMVTVHVAGMNITKGVLIDGLYNSQSWRNAMPFYLQGPSDQDRIVISIASAVLCPAQTYYAMSGVSCQEANGRGPQPA